MIFLTYIINIAFCGGYIQFAFRMAEKQLKSSAWFAKAGKMIDCVRN